MADTDVLISEIEEEEGSVATLRHGVIIMHVGARLTEFARAHGLGFVAGPQTTFHVPGYPPREPDLTFVRKDRLPADLDVEPDFAPDLAVEVVSRSDSVYGMDARVRQYLDSGVRLIWIIHPLLRTVEVFRPDAEPVIVTEGEDLVGEPVLPGFRLRVADICP